MMPDMNSHKLLAYFHLKITLSVHKIAYSLLKFTYIQLGIVTRLTTKSAQFQAIIDTKIKHPIKC